MWINVQSPRSKKGRELGFDRIHCSYDIFNPPWLWGWQEVIAETKEYWILEKNRVNNSFIYVIVCKDTFKAHCYYSGSMRYYGNVVEFSVIDPDKFNLYVEFSDARVEMDSLNEQINKLQSEKKRIMTYLREQTCSE